MNGPNEYTLPHFVDHPTKEGAHLDVLEPLALKAAKIAKAAPTARGSDTLYAICELVTQAVYNAEETIRNEGSE